MIQPKTIDINGLKFYTQPLPAMRAVILDKKIVTLLIPVLGSLDGLKLDDEINFDEITTHLSDALAKLTDSDFKQFLLELLSTTTYQGEVGGTEENEALSESAINKIFQGRLKSMYTLMFRIMEYNKFSPFELLGDGAEILKTLSSSSQKKKELRRGKRSERSDTLLES